MTIRNVWVAVTLIALVALALLFGPALVRGCARETVRAVAGPGLPISLLGQYLGAATPQPVDTVPPGHSAPPRASRRPVFGTERSEGEEIVVQWPSDQVKDSVGLFVAKDGTVRNTGKTTVRVRVTKVGPAVVQWDPSAGLSAVVGPPHDDFPSPLHLAGYPVDVGLKAKLVDIVPVAGLEFGLPTVHLSSAGIGVGVDVKLGCFEHVALDGVYWPLARTWGVGVSLNL
jgi:hypothetical protein